MIRASSARRRQRWRHGGMRRTRRRTSWCCARRSARACTTSPRRCAISTAYWRPPRARAGAAHARHDPHRARPLRRGDARLRRARAPCRRARDSRVPWLDPPASTGGRRKRTQISGRRPAAHGGARRSWPRGVTPSPRRSPHAVVMRPPQKRTSGRRSPPTPRCLPARRVRGFPARSRPARAKPLHSSRAEPAQRQPALTPRTRRGRATPMRHRTSGALPPSTARTSLPASPRRGRVAMSCIAAKRRATRCCWKVMHRAPLRWPAPTGRSSARAADLRILAEAARARTMQTPSMSCAAGGTSTGWTTSR